MNKDLLFQIQEISFAFAKYHYEQYLKKHDINQIESDKINEIIQDMYTSDKKKELYNFIRQTLKKMYAQNYNSLAVEQIIMEMSADDVLAVSRICTEIELYQKSKLKE
mgnify:CR=1 FL=1|tara:strand:- start:909 stop:1232 length:324 start_codon:yes stop_codon:yes gene_type:complete